MGDYTPQAGEFLTNALVGGLAAGRASGKDGTSIDYYLLSPKVAAHPGQTPTLMTGYGAFGVSFSPGYLDATVGGASLALWLQRGGALALPLIRGGGDRGEAWHQAAIRDKRQNSYETSLRWPRPSSTTA